MIYLSKPDITDREKEAVLAVLDSGFLGSGPKVREFEEKFSIYNNVKHTVCVANGTVALHAAYLSLGLQRGDKVLTTPFTFIATSNAVLFFDGKVVFADIDKDSFNLDPNKVEDILKKDSEIKAITLVHLYGNSCDMSAFDFLAKKYNVKIIEDCAQSIGAECNGVKTGSFGEVGTFSLYATKNMMSGEGGLITTNDDIIATNLRSLINHGRDGRFLHSKLGYNYRLTDMQAALGLVQLERLEEFITKRRYNAEFYDQEFSNIEWLETPKVVAENKHVYHQYTLKVSLKIRDKFIEYLNNNGVNAAAIYPIPVHKQPFYEKIEKFSLPVAENIANQVVCLPVHTKLTQQDLEIVAKTVKGFEGC